MSGKQKKLEIPETLIILVFILFIGQQNFAQDTEIDSLLQTVQGKETSKVSGAFKSTRVIQAHSIEMLHKRNLDVRILHRFGTINSGIDELFGLNQASTRIGFDYGFSDNVSAGFGRSTK